jgi:YegS/Rv2252/BmrU family lipid kinase
LIVNPVSGSFSTKRLDRVKTTLQTKYRLLDIYFTKTSGDATERARVFSQRGCDLVVAYGGDGTLNEVINGVAFTDTAVGFIPSGTTNVFAREAGIPDDPVKAADLIVNATYRYIHAGSINNKRFFLLMTGVGFDAWAVCGVRPKVKRYLGKLSYILSGLEVLAKNPLQEIQVIVDRGRSITCSGIIICNASRYAGDFRVCPGAGITRPELSAVVFGNGSRRSTLRYILGIITGNHLKYKDIMFLKGRHFLVKGSSRVQIDGDCYGGLPVEVTLIENVVRMVF